MGHPGLHGVHLAGGWGGGGSSKLQGSKDNLCWPHTPWVPPCQDRACCPGLVPAAIPRVMISDSIGEDRPPGMSQLALLLFAFQSWKNYTVHLAVLAAAGFSSLSFFLLLFF